MMEHGWFWGVVPLQKKEYKELLEKAEKLEAVKKAWLETAKEYLKDGGDPEIDAAIAEIGRPLIGVEIWNLEEMVKILEAEG